MFLCHVRTLDGHMRYRQMSDSSERIYGKYALLLFFAVGVNLALGALVESGPPIPLYLDSIGTILAGALLGPLAGAAVGAFTNLLWGMWLNNPAILPFAITSAFVGWAAGFAVSRGAFARFRTVVLSGLLVGLGAAIVSAPIAAFVFGNLSMQGAEFIQALLAATGANVLQAATIQGLLSDPLDKTLSFIAAWLLWRALKKYFPAPSQRGARVFDALHGYNAAVAVSLVALLLSFVFLPAFERGIFAVFYIAVVISAWRGGFGPALLSTIIGAAAQILFLESPFYSSPVTPQDLLRVGIFVLVSLAIGVIADQLERHKRELAKSLQAERASQARIRAITDSVDEALLLVAPDQRVLNINHRFAEFFEIPAERIVGSSLSDLKTFFEQTFDDANLFGDLVAAANGERTFVKQILPRTRELQIHATPVRDGENILGSLVVLRDVTHERQVDRMKTEFVSLVSHELRTPLTSIKGFTEMVLDGDAGEINDEVRDYLGVVFNNAERLVALVNDLLDISRMESGRIKIKSERVDLNDIVRIVVATMEQKIREKQQTLAVATDPDAALVTGDHDKLVQVLTNYVSNAHKYTQSGGSIRIEITRENNFARVAVMDNGFGISPQDREKLFTRFYRVDNSMTREIGGTGLGLAIVKQLIELQGGAVGVASELGKGSTFFFTVPLVPTQNNVSPARVAVPAQNAPSAARAADILVVEDDAAVARVFAQHLQAAGYTVRVASSAEDARTQIQANLPDLITLDMELPDMQGEALALQLKSDALTRDIPVLALAVFADDPARLQFGAYTLPKPVAQDELVTNVSALLHAAPQGPVLVIDDDADVRRLLQAALERNDLRVETAADAASGLAQANALHPALILLDMRLPDRDGFAVLRALKEDAATADIPVIVMTGSPDLKNTARARACVRRVRFCIETF